MNVIRQAPAPTWGVNNVKFYYLTQTHQKPPAFIAFANHPDGVTPPVPPFLSEAHSKGMGFRGDSDPHFRDEERTQPSRG